MDLLNFIGKHYGLITLILVSGIIYFLYSLSTNANWTNKLIEFLSPLYMGISTNKSNRQSKKQPLGFWGVVFAIIVAIIIIVIIGAIL